MYAKKFSDDQVLTLPQFITFLIFVLSKMPTNATRLKLLTRILDVLKQDYTNFYTTRSVPLDTFSDILFKLIQDLTK